MCNMLILFNRYFRGLQILYGLGKFHLHVVSVCSLCILFCGLTQLTGGSLVNSGVFIAFPLVQHECTVTCYFIPKPKNATMIRQKCATKSIDIEDIYVTEQVYVLKYSSLICIFKQYFKFIMI